ncbi:MAG: hypothetical protein ACRD0C_19180 [Acidimicrobiia bacterium]
MAEQEPVPEADAQEQAALAVAVPDEDELDEIPTDANEADVLEQARPLAAAPNGHREIPADVPEADALDQERPADTEEDDWR